ncbi:MAG TPA: hypothetical protein VGJ86_21880 [Acidimicrobiales bacterium]|jgi:hypothetical protein
MSHQNDAQRLTQCIGVIVRTPAGATSAFAIDEQDTADRLIERAADWFVTRDLLEPGRALAADERFRLGLVRGTTIVDLEPDAELLAEGLVEGDVLHLLNREPQVDGHCLR